MAKATKKAQQKASEDARSYSHPQADLAARPEIGTQAHYRKNKPPAAYQYDSSLSPALQWAGKAERVSFEVPTLPLFIHERLSTRAILETKGFDPQKQVKHAAAERWCAAVNAHGGFGRWNYRMVESVCQVTAAIHSATVCR